MESIRFFTLPDSDIVFFCSDGCLYVNEAYLEWAAEGRVNRRFSDSACRRRIVRIRVTPYRETIPRTGRKAYPPR
jgi:hypothetical protein